MAARAAATLLAAALTGSAAAAAAKDGENCLASRSGLGACEADGACFKQGGAVVCAPAKAAGGRCAHARECAVGALCEDGRCTAAPAEGEDCQGIGIWGCGREGWCGEDGVCMGFQEKGWTCERWFECGATMTCFDGACAPTSKVGGVCYADWDCAEGECDLDANECRRGKKGAPCSSDLGCTGDMQCSEDDECVARNSGEEESDADEEEADDEEADEKAGKDEDDGEEQDEETVDEVQDVDENEEGGDADGASKSSTSNRAAILGGGIGGGLVLLALIVAGVFCWRRHDAKRYAVSFAGESSNFSTYAGV